MKKESWYKRKIEFENKVSCIVIIIFFVLFGIAYAAQYIGDLDSDTSPTSDDLVETENNPSGCPGSCTSRSVALGDLPKGMGLSSTDDVTFNSIAVAPSSEPRWIFDDSDSLSENNDAKIYIDSTDTGDGSEDTTMYFQCMIDGTLTQMFALSGGTNSVDIGTSSSSTQLIINDSDNTNGGIKIYSDGNSYSSRLWVGDYQNRLIIESDLIVRDNASGGSNTALLLRDSTNDVNGGVMYTKTTANQDYITYFQTAVAGAATNYMELDGVTETVDILKPTTIAGTLSVTGAITGASCCGADYVFDKNYKLPTLKEVDNHIKEVGHLPGMTEGVGDKLNKLNLTKAIQELIVKTEEQQLYILQLQAQIDELKNKNN